MKYHSRLNWMQNYQGIHPVAPRYIQKPKSLITTILLIISIFYFFYKYTNIFIDRDDPATWNINRRVINNTILLNRPYNERFDLLSCEDFTTENKSSIVEMYKNKGRLILNINDRDIPLTCTDIRRRLQYDRRINETVENTYAISRVVYENYFWIENELSHTYSKNNYYCFAVDSKSSEDFFEALKKLEECIPNVVVLNQRFPYDSSGHYINFGHWHCTNFLLELDKNWKYILWLQNYDIFLKTNQEISQIIKFLNGSQSVGYKPAQLKRYNFLRSWSAKSLQLWKNESAMTERQANAKLHIAQMYNEVFLSRQIIEFVEENMNMENLLAAFEQPLRYATDELLWSTLLASPDLRLPGQPEKGCHTQKTYITRYNEWRQFVTCKSEFSRHGTCIFGIEYFPIFSELHQIVANKVMPSFDYGIVLCMGQLLYNRSHGLAQSSPSMNIYSGIAKNYC